MLKSFQEYGFSHLLSENIFLFFTHEILDFVSTIMNATAQLGKAYLLLVLLLIICMCAPQKDQIKQIPGFPKDYPTKVYGGYLKTQSETRKHYYLFTQSINGVNNKDPLILYLAGGPGCSAAQGFIQQMGPYYLQDGKDYKQGDLLTQNNYSWHKLVNLLFIEQPGDVGFSVNTNPNHRYNDINAMDDLMTSLLDFFDKFSEYKGRQFWISGTSYAGVFVPNLAVRVDAYNNKPSVDQKQKIKLKGLLVGNGAISFYNFKESGYEYMMNHDLIDPQIQQVYQRSCKYDPESAGCKYFLYKYEQDIKKIDSYDIYGYCYPGSGVHTNLNNTCFYVDGMQNYFNLNKQTFKVDSSNKQWMGPCSQIITSHYDVDPAGSINSYKYLLPLGLKILLFNGDWDSLMPQLYVVRDLQEKLNLKPTQRTPFFVNDQHAGFIQYYSNISFIAVKGGGHTPKTKRQVVYNILKQALQDKELIKHRKQQQ